MPRPGRYLIEQRSGLGHLQRPPIAYGRCAEPSYLVYYLERADGRIKIGCTGNYPRRRHALLEQHGPLSLVAWEEGDSRIERARHRQFGILRVDPIAEWFEPGPQLIDWILNLRALVA